MASSRMGQNTLAVITTFLYVMIVVTMNANRVQSESKVTIKNEAGSDVWCHCQSGDDLGTHVLHDQQEWYCMFHASIIRDTEFYCWFEWINNDGLIFKQDFPVWVEGGRVYKDVKCGQCLWYSDNTGFSIWDKATQSFIHAYDWTPSLDNTTSLHQDLGDLHSGRL
jgi:hypothetical protein